MKKLLLAALGSLAISAAFAQPSDADVEREPVRDIRVHLEDGWIVAGQGRDETGQLVKVWIWGTFWEPAFIQRRFEQLDDDPEREYIVISRSPGTGPYYKLQIIDFPPEGILTWSFDSMGTPRIEDGMILLGDAQQYLGDAQQYEGAATIPRYRVYTYTKGGLVPVKR